MQLFYRLRIVAQGAHHMQHGSQQLYQSVRAAMIQNGSSLNQWCEQNGVKRQWVTLALKGDRKGPSAERVLKLVVGHLGLSK